MASWPLRNQDHGKNSQIIEDFQALRKTVEDMNLFKSNQLFFLLHLAHIIAMESIAWFTLFYFGNGWIPTIITAFVLATSQVRRDTLTCHLKPLPPASPSWQRPGA